MPTAQGQSRKTTVYLGSGHILKVWLAHLDRVQRHTFKYSQAHNTHKAFQIFGNTHPPFPVAKTGNRKREIFFGKIFVPQGRISIALHILMKSFTQFTQASVTAHKATRQSYKPITSAKVEVWLEKNEEGNIVTRIDHIEIPASKRFAGEGTKEIKNIMAWSKKMARYKLLLRQSEVQFHFGKNLGLT